MNKFPYKLLNLSNSYTPLCLNNKIPQLLQTTIFSSLNILNNIIPTPSVLIPMYRQLSEDIRKKLASTKGYNVSHKFVDSYDSLVKLVGGHKI